MYREKAKVEPYPSYPREETPEERKKRLMQSERLRKARAVLMVALVPCALLMTLGFYWDRMSTAMAVMGVLSTIIASVGFGISTSIKTD